MEALGQVEVVAAAEHVLAVEAVVEAEEAAGEALLQVVEEEEAAAEEPTRTISKQLLMEAETTEQAMVV